MLAIGGIASLLALVGKVPLRWVIGGNEFDMSEEVANDIADAVASQVDPAGTAQIAEDLAASESGLRSPLANAMFEYVAFEQAAIERVTQAIQHRPGWSYEAARAPEDRRIDGLIVTEDNRRIGVEYKLIRSVNAGRRLLKMIRDQRAERAEGALILIVSATAGPNLATLANRVDLAPLGVQLVDGDNPNFPRNFLAACEEAIGWLKRRPEQSDG